jgi:hypothetical protein
MNRLHFIKNIIATKMGKTEQYLAKYPIWAHFPYRKSAKEVQKRWKINLHQMYFSNTRMVWYHKGSFFGMKRDPGWGVVACNVETQCQNLNCISVQTTGVVLLAPNFMNHLVISFKRDLRQKSHISGHLLS